MEVAVERPPVKEEKREANEEIGTLGSATPIVLESFLPTQRDPSICKQDEKLESAKAAMDEVREENERLRGLLSSIVREYQSLQTHFLDAVKLQPPVKNAASPSVAAAPAPAPNAGGADAEPELVLLRLGTSSIAHQKCEKLAASEGADDEALSLGLGREVYGGRCTNEDSGTDEVKTDEPGEPCQRSKECRDLSAADDEDGRHQQVKKARVSVRAKCDTPTMNDGCQWRKYGQKISKGNPCPRAYYRCTIAPACPVRKQVQRCADDMSILITTYEGAHNHPLPPAAAALASATSVAASMITSGERISSSSYSQHHLPLMSTGGLFSPTAISSTATCPTVTLDLTTPHSLLSSYASTSYESRALPAAWSSGCLAYGSQPYYVRSSPFGHLGVSGVGESIARPIGHEQLHQSYLQKASSLAGGEATTTATDTIAKVITSDPSFQSVLAAAITSYIGCNAAQR